jgi:hypothetical protein
MVITPIPPTWINPRIIIFPRVVNRVAVSTAVKPVTHTALVEVKKALVKEMGEWVDCGIISRNAPLMMINPKLITKSWAGLNIFDIHSIRNLDISRINRKNVIKWNIVKLWKIGLRNEVSPKINLIRKRPRIMIPIKELVRNTFQAIKWSVKKSDRIK